MRVSIETDGGFTGRGVGSASAEIDDGMISHLRPGTWLASYPAHGADLVTYTLTVGGKRVSWTEGAEIPADLRELFELVWEQR
jgi:hypothetical protein